MYSILPSFDAVTVDPLTPAPAFGAVEGVGPNSAAYLYADNASDTDVALVAEGALAASFFVLQTGKKYRIGPFSGRSLAAMGVWASAAAKTVTFTPVSCKLSFTRTDRQNAIALASQEAGGTYLPENADPLPFVFEEII